MPELEMGVSSSEVAKLQQNINKILGRGSVPTDGTFDERTRDKLAELQLKMDVLQTGKLDRATSRAMDDAIKNKRTKVVVNGKVAWVTAAQLKSLQAKAGASASKAVEPYVSMAKEAQILWTAHDKARRDNAFWSAAVDLATGATFPSKSTMDGATKAATALKTAAASGKLTEQGLSRRTAPIRVAFAAMDQYRQETFGGGAELISNLETIRDTAVVTLQVTSAIATAGATWEIQVGVSAGVAAYEATLKEVDTASKTASYSIGKGLSNVFIASVVDATVGLLMKGGAGGGLGKILDDSAEGAIKNLSGGPASKFIKEYAIRMANGGGQKLIEDGIKGLPGLADPKKKFTKDQLIKAAAESFFKGAGLKMLGPVADKYAKGASKHLDRSKFKGLGDVNLEKSAAEQFNKLVDAVGTTAVKATLGSWSVKKAHSNFEKEVTKKILNDPKIKRFIQAQKKKQGKK